MGDRAVENAVWSYEDPFAETRAIKDYLAFYWPRLDRWYEEDEEVFVHPRDPFVRVDVLDSARRVTVRLGGQVLADTRRARFLFETGWPARYYLPQDDVRFDLLQPSDTRTRCPYKGTAGYWHFAADGRRVDDVAWCYGETTREGERIRGYVCFDPDKVDAVEVERP